MANELWLKPTGCFLLNSWLSVFVPILFIGGTVLVKWRGRTESRAAAQAG